MIPDFQAIMLPIMKIVSDKKPHLFRDVVNTLMGNFKLSDEDKNKMLPSGTQPVFENRASWSKSHLKKACLLAQPRRGYIQITDRGLSLLDEKFDKIDIMLLMRFDEYKEFRTGITSNKGGTANQGGDGTLVSVETHTPEEQMETAFQDIKKILIDEILEKVHRVSPSFFERIVVDLLVKMGYGGSVKDAGKAIGKTNDEGIDGTIKEDKLGLDVIYIQAKRWKDGHTVGRPELQTFVGALAGQGAKKGIFITASKFSNEALKYTPKNETKIVLIDGIQLAELMIEHNVGVSNQQMYEIKKIDNDYFEED